MQTVPRNKLSGFTLIELMIVVAIIGVLATIAMPAYQNYVRQSEAASALATLKGLISPAEVFYQANGTASAATLTNLGIAADSNRLGTIASNIDDEEEGEEAKPNLTFTFGARSSMGNGDTITYQRDAETGWSCETAGNVPELDGCSQ